MGINVSATLRPLFVQTHLEVISGGDTVLIHQSQVHQVALHFGRGSGPRYTGVGVDRACTFSLRLNLLLIVALRPGNTVTDTGTDGRPLRVKSRDVVQTQRAERV